MGNSEFHRASSFPFELVSLSHDVIGKCVNKSSIASCQYSSVVVIAKSSCHVAVRHFSSVVVHSPKTRQSFGVTDAKLSLGSTDPSDKVCVFFKLQQVEKKLPKLESQRKATCNAEKDRKRLTMQGLKMKLQ